MLDLLSILLKEYPENRPDLKDLFKIDIVLNYFKEITLAERKSD